MKITSKINTKSLKFMHDIAIESLVETADAASTNLKRSKTLPFDTGNLQNRSANVQTKEKDKGVVSITHDTPYARRLYFHPEYNFKKDKNPNAGGMWYEPYINGKKKNYASKAFARIMRGKMK